MVYNRRMLSRIASAGMLALAGGVLCYACGDSYGEDAPPVSGPAVDAAASKDVVDSAADVTDVADAGLDAEPSLGCVGSKAFFCATFDDGPTVFTDGVKLSLVGKGEVRPPAISAPNALWLSDVHPGLVDVARKGSGAVTKLTAKMQVRIASLVDVDVAILRLGIIVSTGTCFVDLRPNKETLILQSHCGQPDQYVFTQVLSALPAPDSYLELLMTTDFALGTTSVRIGGIVASLTHKAEPQGGAPMMSFGVEASNLPFEIGYDDVVVTASP